MKKIIKILNTNNYSINLRSDFTNKEKLNAYYPTFNNMRLLDKFLLSIKTKANGATILSGAYGTGKSYFTALLASILSSELKVEDYRYLIDKSKQVYDIEETLKTYSDKKYLIVFIDESMDSFSEGVFSGIRRALKEKKIEINITSKIDIIEKKLKFWKENYEAIYQKFIERLNEEDFSQELKYKTVKTEIIFSKVYSEIFAGEKFSYNGEIKNLKELLQEVEKGVKEKGYDGVFYVFDEFGRYLETNINNIDVKEIQDTAEYCNLDNNSNLLMITHKDIFQYTRKIKNKVEKDEWEKVSGRFLKEHLIFEKDSVLKILKNIIQKNEYEDFREKNPSIKTKEVLLKGVIEGNVEEQTKNFYPLDYITAITLPELSQKLAQNERTLFAFICSDEPKALKNLIYDSNDEKDFITVDYLYDYFERELKQLPVDSLEYKTYIASKDIISKIPKTKDREIDIKIVKAIAMIYVYSNFLEIKPNLETLRYIFNNESLNLDYLEENKLVVFKKYQNQYKLLEDVNFDIEKKIQEYCENKLGRFDYIKRLEIELGKDVYYPLKYNDLNKVNRYFGQYYVDVSNLSKLEELKKNFKEDGRIVYITNIEENSNYEEIIKKLSESKDYILIRGNESKLEIYNELKELEAISFLKEDERVVKNETLTIEVELYRSEIKDYIEKKIEAYFGKNQDLLQKTYNYLNDKYFKYVGINYELINKKVLSAPMKKSRYEVLNRLDNNIELTEEYFKDTKAESSVARVLLYNTGLYKKDIKKKDYFKFKNLLEDITLEIKKENCSFEELYLKYCSNKGEYGIREGVFTFLLGLIYIENKEQLVFSYEEGKSEVNFTLDILDLIEKNPEKYRVGYYEINSEEVKYMEKLHIILSKYIKSNDSKIYNRILDGIKNYLLDQPRYVGNIFLTNIKGLNRIFKNIFVISSAKEFILKDLLKIYKTNSYKKVLEQLEIEIINLEEQKKEFKENLNEISAEILSNGEFKNLRLYIESISSKKNSLEIENYLENLKSLSDEDILKSLTKKINGFSFDNWRGETDIDKYKEILNKEVLKNNKSESIQSESSCLKIEFNGKEEKIALSEKLDLMEKMLSSKISAAIKNMGFSLTIEQKKKVVAKILLEIQE